MHRADRRCRWSRVRSLKLGAAPIAIGAAQSQAKMVIQAAKDSPLGNAIPVVVRAVATIKGEVD